MILVGVNKIVLNINLVGATGLVGAKKYLMGIDLVGAIVLADAKDSGGREEILINVDLVGATDLVGVTYFIVDAKIDLDSAKVLASDNDFKECRVFF